MTFRTIERTGAETRMAGFALLVGGVRQCHYLPVFVIGRVVVALLAAGGGIGAFRVFRMADAACHKADVIVAGMVMAVVA